MADGNMIPLLPQSDGRLAWGNGVISMLFDVTGDSPVRLANVAGRGMAAAEGGLSGAVAVVERDARPIVEVRAANTGSQDNRLSLIATVAGGKLRFVSAHASEPAEDSGDPYRLEITQFASYDALQPMGREFEPVATERDRPSEDAAPSPHCERAQGIEASPTIPGNATDAPQPGLTVTSVFEAYPGLSAVRTHTRLRSPEPFSVEAVSSMNLTVPLTVNGGTVESSHLLWGDAAWAVENDWHMRPLRETSVRDRNQRINPGQSSSRFALSSTSIWSTGMHEPAGIV